ncbi:MAG: hypothetical protein PVH61_28685 [Candidatus Aminicenantes bacterium]|jgi:hypothetical protein
MEDLFKKFLQVLEAFEKEEVDYILVGGLAVILHGMPRLTQDIDVFVKMNPGNIGKLQKALHRVYQDDESINEITLDELNHYSVIRYGSPDGFYIDIMARLGEVATYDNLEYETIIVDEISIKVATAEKLFELKKDTLRLEDKRDAFFLSELIRKNKE